jgi:ribosome-associated translation inhibitor RaiA
MNSQLTPEQRKQRTENIVKAVGLLAVLFILGTTTIATTIITGIGVLGALILAGAGVFTVSKFLPYFAMKIGNARLKAIKAEAMKNPVETLQNQLVKKREALAQFKEQIRIFAGQVLSFTDQVKQYVKEGLEDAQVYVDQLAKMNQLLKLRQEKCKQAEVMIGEFEDSIERTDRKWKMALAAQAMNEAAGEIAGDVFDKICIETSVNAVQDKLNESMADLEMALMDEENKRQIEAEKANKRQLAAPVVTVDATPVAERQKIAVR